MRRSLVLCASLLVGCASSGSTTSSSPTRAGQTVQVGGADGGAVLRIAPTEVTHTNTLAFAPDRVWLALPAVLDSLGVPVGTMESSKRIIGNSTLKVRSRLKSVPLSRYVDCGAGGQIGPNADTYDIVLTVFAEVRPAASGATTLTTTFDAVGRPINYSQEYAQCRSKGVFESRLLELLQNRLR